MTPTARSGWAARAGAAGEAVVRGIAGDDATATPHPDLTLIEECKDFQPDPLLKLHETGSAAFRDRPRSDPPTCSGYPVFAAYPLRLGQGAMQTPGNPGEQPQLA